MVAANYIGDVIMGSCYRFGAWIRSGDWSMGWDYEVGAWDGIMGL
jgi:hypothetical protein